MALASNLAFIAYGYLANLMPVLILHAVLLPAACSSPPAFARHLCKKTATLSAKQ